MFRSNLLTRLMSDGKMISLLDENWETESAYKLCHWIDSPNHPYYGLYKKDVDDNHTFLINAQNEDGSWMPCWRWGDAEVWKGVEHRIKGQYRITDAGRQSTEVKAEDKSLVAYSLLFDINIWLNI